MKCKDCCAYLPGGHRHCGARIIPGHKCPWGKEKVDDDVLSVRKERGDFARQKRSDKQSEKGLPTVPR